MKEENGSAGAGSGAGAGAGAGAGELETTYFFSNGDRPRPGEHAAVPLSKVSRVLVLQSLSSSSSIIMPDNKTLRVLPWLWRRRCSSLHDFMSIQLT